MLSTLKSATSESIADIKQELSVRKISKFVILFSMGSQFDHLIVQRLSATGVFVIIADPASIKSADITQLQQIGLSGIIVSGGPASVESEPPPFDTSIFDIGLPTLGICLGFQMISAHIGAKVISGEKREFGVHKLHIIADDELFADIPDMSPVLQSHGDKILPHDTLTIIGSTDNAPVAAGRYKHLYGVQFHPEVSDSRDGGKLLDNFCAKICKISERFPAELTANAKIQSIRNQITDKRILIALSGGSDSAVVAYLLKNAVREKTSCSSVPRIRGVYIRGIDRPDDEANVHKFFDNQDWIDIKIVDATQNFLSALKGAYTMRDKRVAMRGVYREVLENEIKDFGADFIAQGTLYTDMVESGTGHDTGARRAQIKLHHNVHNNFSVTEIKPLEDCVKDSARDIGRHIGVPEELLVRHPFPGPGLVVRIEGEVTSEMLKVARAVDGIYIQELRNYNLYDTVWQAGATVTISQHTASKGDDASDGHVVALWAVWSVNGFTARWAELPNDFLRHVSQRITNEIREVAAVVYRISDKPPATIEWG